MRIYLDESKQIDKWKIVIWWFFTYHNTNYLEKFLNNKKDSFWIPNNAELKSTKKYWKQFLEQLSNDNDFKNLDIKVFWFKYENYFYESEKWYINLIIDVLINILSTLKLKTWEKINIFHDNLNAKNNKNTETKVENILNNHFWIKSNFKIHNSKKYTSLQLADLITWDYRKLYLYNDINKLSEIFLKKEFKNKKT
jgi:hypothetical protein